MSETEQIIPAVPATLPVVLDEQPLIYAVDPQAVSAAGLQMAEFFRRRREEMQVLAEEQEKGYEEAVAHKWKSSTLKKAAGITRKRFEFYHKIVLALEAGYLVIPNLPLDVFAIRTDRKKPRGAGGNYTDDSWQNRHGSHTQEPNLIPAGEGRNRNPSPSTVEIFDERVRKTRDGKEEVYQVAMSKPEDWRQMDFPIALAKPAIMSQAQGALALKVFDEMGVVNDRIGGRTNPKADPIMVGRIRNPRTNRPDVSFFIAWAADVTRI